MDENIIITVDAIVQIESTFIMIERKNFPFGWALPGGKVEVDETLEEAIIREVKEETDIDYIDFKQFKTYSDIDRDPRGRYISTVFFGKGIGTPKPKSDAINLKLVNFNYLPSNIAFDHKNIIKDFIELMGYMSREKFLDHLFNAPDEMFIEV